MKAELYRAAQRGNWADIQEFADQIFWQRTAGGNTVLHVVAQCRDYSDAVQQILESEPRLIYKRNAKSETALHLAASKGHFNVAEALLSFAKRHGSWLISGDVRCCEMLWATNKEGNTALHEAVRYNFYNVVKLLVEESRPFSYGNPSPNICVSLAARILIITKSRHIWLGCDSFTRLKIMLELKDAGFRYRPNYAGESPLYLALENENCRIAEKILSDFNSPSFTGPGKRTALHAAALGKFPECMGGLELILEKLPQLTKKVDKYGWTVLHYAAKFNHQEVASQLLRKDKSMAYISAHKDDSKAALHVAVIHGHVGVMREILSGCPDCWEMITDEGWNILHLAVKNEHEKVLEFILQNSWAVDLINQKDVKGNTPLHLYVATKSLKGHDLVNYPCVNRNATNDAGLTPLDTITESDEVTDDRQRTIKGELEQTDATQRIPKTFIIKKKAKVSKDDAENWERTSGPLMIIATLMVTVTFAAGFTIPGGYNGEHGKNEGMAILAKKTALAAFAISDSYALMVSVAVVFHLFYVHSRPDLWKDPFQLLSIRMYISHAMTSMEIAFVSGLFAVLPVLGIKIFLCGIAIVFCLPIVVYMARLYLEVEKRIARIMV